MDFRVGDKVRIIKPLYSDNPRLGEVMIVASIRDGETIIDYILKDIEDEWHYVKRDEIELIQGFRTSKEIEEMSKKRNLKNDLIHEEVEDLKTEQKYTKHSEICNRLNDLYISKNKEYGDSFGKAYKEIGIMSGVSDIYHKVQRLVNITKNKEEELKYESLEDTIIDLANYAVMLLTELELEKCRE